METSFTINADPNIEQAQVNDIVAEEVKHYKELGKEILSIDLTLDGADINVVTKERSPIIRTRRITGYLSTVDRFNDSKAAELADRKASM